jgi:hypothetical protein
MMSMMSEQVIEKYGCTLTGLWPENSLEVLEQALSDFSAAFHLTLPLHLPWMHKLEIRLENLVYGGLTFRGLIRLNPEGLSVWTVTHELGHAWDYSRMCLLSFRMMIVTGSAGAVPLLHAWQPLQKNFWYKVGDPPPPCGVDQNFNRFEDFAETVAAYVYPKEAFQRAVASGSPYGHYGYTHFHQTPRGRFMADLAYSLQKQEMALTP